MRAPHAPREARGGVLPRRAFPRSGRHFSGGALPRRAHRMRRRAAEGYPPRPFPAFLGEVAASRAAQSALRRIRPPPGIVGRAGTAGGSSLAGLSVFWGIVRRGGLIGVVRRAGAFFYLYEAPARFAGPGRVPSRGIAPCGSFCIRRPFAAGESARGLLAGPVLRTACSGGSAWAPMRAF